MPTYLYECEKCGRFEKMQRITADPLQECPKCGANVKKLIGKPGVIFKGSGFYSTDSDNNSSSSCSSCSSCDTSSNASNSDTSSSDNKEKVS